MPGDGQEARFYFLWYIFWGLSIFTVMHMKKTTSSRPGSFCGGGSWRIAREGFARGVSSDRHSFVLVSDCLLK
jgi:hypothetical protein